MLADVDAGQLAAAVFTEAQRHPPRSSERRAAAHLWVALTDTRTVDAARRALATFGAEHTQTAALELLGRIAAELRNELPLPAGTQPATERTPNP